MKIRDPSDKPKNHTTMDKTKPLFIHVPKTSGRYIKSVVETKLNYFIHRPANNIKQSCNFYDDIESFAIIRNPYDRFVSAFNFNPQNKNADINEFVFNVHDNPMDFYARFGPHREHFNTQTYFLTDDNDNIIVKKLFRYENLQECYDWLNEKLQVSLQVKDHNSHWEDVLTAESITYLTVLYRRDFAMLGYLPTLT